MGYFRRLGIRYKNFHRQKKSMTSNPLSESSHADMAIHELKNWENSFASAIQKIALPKRSRAGVLLSVVPDHSQWDDYLSSIRTEWQNWRPTLWQHQSCLLVLYAGLAFYEYDENTFWPQFAKSVGSDPLPANQQQEINGAFAKATKYFGLELKLRDNGTDFVGSAVHYIGIPLSLWDGFLGICEWALWRADWKTLSDEEWKEAVEKRAGGRQRLKRFLTGNRDTASSFIQEILDVRDILASDTNLTISSLLKASILRAEYFDEVPETAEFLRLNPDFLFQDRARLIWNEQRKQLCLQLPSVEQEKLPATWHVGTHSQGAAPSPDALILNSGAFRNPLLLTLESGNHSETQRLRGVDSWGLFDTEGGGRLVNMNRDELPLKSYTLVSLKKIEILREGFDENENPVNEQFELADGTPCFVTRLWPTGKYAEVRVQDGNQVQRIIHFKSRTRIEICFFVGWGRKAAYFSRPTPNKIKMDHLPVLCVSIPNNYFRNNDVELARSFKVLIDGKSASGRWERRNVHVSTDSEFYNWKWDKRPFLERKPGINILTSFAQLRDAYRSPDLGGNRTIAIESIPHIRKSFDVELH